MEVFGSSRQPKYIRYILDGDGDWGTCSPRGFAGGRGSCSVGGASERITSQDKTSWLPCFILLARRDMAVRTESRRASLPEPPLTAAVRKRETQRRHIPHSSPVINVSTDQSNVCQDTQGRFPTSRFAIETTGFSRPALSFLLVICSTCCALLCSHSTTLLAFLVFLIAMTPLERIVNSCYAERSPVRKNTKHGCALIRIPSVLSRRTPAVAAIIIISINSRPYEFILVYRCW